MRFGILTLAAALVGLLAGSARAGDGCCRTSAVLQQQVGYYDAAPAFQAPVYAPVQQQVYAPVQQVQVQKVIRQQAVYAQPVQVVRQKVVRQQFVRQQAVYGYGGFGQQQFVGRQRFVGGGFARAPGGGGGFGRLLGLAATGAGAFGGASVGGPVGAIFGGIAGQAVGEAFQR